VSTSLPSSAWHRWGRWLSLGLAGGALALLVLTFFLSRFLDPEALAARVEPRLETALGREVEIGSVEVGLFPLGIRLREVAVADPTGLAPYLARVGSLDFRVEILPLLRREVRVRRLVVDQPEADLRIGEDGRSNFGDLAAEPPSGGEEIEPDPERAAFGLALRGIRISDGSLRFHRLQDSMVVNVQDLRLRATVQRESGGPWVFVGGSESRLTLGLGGDPSILERAPLSTSFDLEAGPDFESLEIRSGSLGTEPLVLAASGSIRDLKEPVRNVLLTVRGEAIPLDRAAEALASQVSLNLPGKVRGLVDAEVQVEGELGPEATPRISGTMKVTGAGLEAPDGTLVAQDLSAQLETSGPDRLRFEIAGEVLDGPFALEGTGSLEEPGRLSAQLRANPDLGLLGSAVELPEGVSILGRIDSDLRIEGSPRDPRSLRLRGEISPNGLELTHPALAVPVTIPRGRISLLGNGASFADLPLSLGEDDLLVSGQLQDLSAFGLPGRVVGVTATVRGPRLDLTRLSSATPPDPELTYGRVAFARLGERRVLGRTPEEAAAELRLSRPDSIPVAGELQVGLDTLVYAKGRMEQVRARVEFGPSVLRVTEASFRRFGGEVWTNMNLALGGRSQQPFNVSLRVRNLDAAAFLGAVTPIGNALHGSLSMDVDLVGNLDGFLLPDRPSLVGSGRFSLEGGGLNSNPLTQALSSFMGMDSIRTPDIESWSTSLVVEEGRIRLADGRLVGTPGDPLVGGSVGFGGELDLRSIFEIDADNLGAYALDNLGIQDPLAGRMEGRPGIVQAVVRMGGTVLAPEFRADPGATARTLTEAARAEVQAEAEREIEEQRTRLQNRATGFLRSLLRPGDTAGPPVPDTAAGDTLLPDSIRPDTIRPDTARADTVRPDTIRPDTARPPSGAVVSRGRG